jgi:lipid II:glycine glycyltransferase (peptidoglycan interpeptide bridge formation enzyme)
MAPVARRNIRRAEDRGVTFQTEGLEAIGEFRRIATLMPGFDDDWGGFQIDFFEELLQCPGVFLFSVRFKRIMIAAAIITLFHNHAYYLFGVTDRKFQKHRASDFLQYQIMLWLAVHKITSYDLGYVSAKKDNDNPKKVSISRFKKKFGGVNLPHVRLELL